MFKFYIDPDVDIKSLEFSILTKKIEEELKLDTLPDPEVFSYFSPDTNYSQNIHDKIDSLHHGIKHLLNILAPHNLDIQEIEKKFLLFKKAIPLKITKLNGLKNIRKKIGEFSFRMAIYLRSFLEGIAPDFLSDDKKKDVLRILKLIDRAEEFYIASTPRPTICTVTKINDGILHAQLDTPLNTFQRIVNGINNPIYQDFELIINNTPPEWFKRLPALYQKLVTDFAEKIINNPEKIYTLSSRTEIVPGVRNLSQHYSMVAGKGGVSSTSAFRSSHIGAVFDTEEQLIEEDYLHFVKLNFISLQLLTYEKFKGSIDKDKLYFLFQTLVTPLAASDDSTLANLKERVLRNPEEDIDFVTMIPPNLHVLDSNHALNLARILKQSTSSPLTDEHIEFYQQELVFAELNKLLSLNRLDYLSKRAESQIHVAALEEFFARLSTHIIAYCSCKSGKDRAGLKLLVTDAIHLFYVLEKALPIFFEDGLFYEYLEKLLLSVHPSLIAATNAIGAFGLKELANNAPPLLKQRINKSYPEFLAIQHTLGSLNTVLATFKKTDSYYKFYQSFTKKKEKHKDFDTLTEPKTDIDSLMDIQKEIILFLRENTTKSPMQQAELAIVTLEKKNIIAYLSPRMRALILEAQKLINSLRYEHLKVTTIGGEDEFIRPETKETIISLLILFKDAPFNIEDKEYQFCKKLYQKFESQFGQLIPIERLLQTDQLLAIEKRTALGNLIAASGLFNNRKELRVPNVYGQVKAIRVSGYFLQIYQAYQRFLSTIIRNGDLLDAFNKLSLQLQEKPQPFSRSYALRLFHGEGNVENTFIKHIIQQLPSLLLSFIEATLNKDKERLIKSIYANIDICDVHLCGAVEEFIKNPDHESELLHAESEIFFQNLVNLHNLDKFEKNFCNTFKDLTSSKKEIEEIVSTVDGLGCDDATKALLKSLLPNLNKSLFPTSSAKGLGLQ